MLCGRCSHPLHWRECGANPESTAPCRCRNDGYESPAVLLRDTPEDRERLAHLLSNASWSWLAWTDKAPRTEPRRDTAFRNLADAIIAALRGER